MLEIISFIQARLATLGKDEQGATATEYALLVTVIAVALGAAMITFRTYIAGKFTGVSW